MPSKLHREVYITRPGPDRASAVRQRGQRDGSEPQRRQRRLDCGQRWQRLTAAPMVAPAAMPGFLATGALAAAPTLRRRCRRCRRRGRGVDR